MRITPISSPPADEERVVMVIISPETLRREYIVGFCRGLDWFDITGVRCREMAWPYAWIPLEISEGIELTKENVQ